MGNCGTLPILSLLDITDPGVNSLILLVLSVGKQALRRFVPKTLEESDCRLQDHHHCSLGCCVFMQRSRDKLEPNQRAFALLLILLLWQSIFCLSFCFVFCFFFKGNLGDKGLILLKCAGYSLSLQGSQHGMSLRELVTWHPQSTTEMNTCPLEHGQLTFFLLMQFRNPCLGNDVTHGALISLHQFI